MKRILFTLTCLSIMMNVAYAAPRKKNYSYTNNTTNYSYTINNSTAQGVADAMAERNYVGHFGGHGNGYEGCGSGSTPEQAYNNCCFANHTNLVTVDVGYAQGRNGRWFCCRRYR